MNYYYISLGALFIVTAVANSIFGELKSLKVLNSKYLNSARLIWHSLSILLFGFGAILIRIGFPNMQVICVKRLMLLTGIGLMCWLASWGWLKLFRRESLMRH